MSPPSDANPAIPTPTPPRAITWRSVTVGAVASALICGLTPLNDFVLSDTSLTAGFLPLGLVLFELLLIVAINAPLHRYRPKWALGSGELSVVLVMALVACALPNWGLMRFLVPIPVAPFRQGMYDGEFWRTFVGLDLPRWLFPVEIDDASKSSPIVQWFFTRVPEGEPIPWLAWVRPLAAWGVFVAAMQASLVAIGRMVFHQWSANERLPFPLVQVHAALIEPPEPGRALSPLFRSRLLWVGFGVVFAIHCLTGFNAYFPRHVPKIPLSYDFTSILSEEPWMGLRTQVKRSMISFMVVGLTYFIRSRVALSLWGFYLLVNLIGIGRRAQGAEIPYAAWGDQHTGACAAFVLGIFWIGRHHWARIIRNAFGRGGSDTTYRGSFWVCVGGLATMLAWLLVVGVSAWMSVTIVAVILTAHLIVARVAAESGLPFFRSEVASSQVYTNTPITWLSGRDVFFAGVFSALGPLTTRESTMTFAMTGYGVARSAEVGERTERRLGWPIATALLVGFVVAATATLYCQYSYPTPTVADSVPARNFFGAERIPEREVRQPMVNYARGHFEHRSHNPLAHMGIGFGVTVLLEIAALRWAAWPLLPIGYVTSHGAFIGNSWFSIFVGWLIKTLVVRFGGASLYQRSRPLFVGVILGEALAAGVWLIVNAVVVVGGGESRSIRFFP